MGRRAVACRSGYSYVSRAEGVKDTAPAPPLPLLFLFRRPVDLRLGLGLVPELESGCAGGVGRCSWSWHLGVTWRVGASPQRMQIGDSSTSIFFNSKFCSNFLK